MRIAARFFVSAVSLLFVLPALPQSLGNVVVNIPGDASCSTAAHEPGFDVATWKIGGMDTNVTTNGNPGRPQLQNLVLTRSLDACSEPLIKLFLTGRIIPKMTLTQYDSTSSGHVYAAATVSLTESRIDSYSVSGATAARPLETINIVYGTVCISTVAQSASGSLQPAQTVCYDVNRNAIY